MQNHHPESISTSPKIFAQQNFFSCRTHLISIIDSALRNPYLVRAAALELAYTVSDLYQGYRSPPLQSADPKLYTSLCEEIFPQQVPYHVHLQFQWIPESYARGTQHQDNPQITTSGVLYLTENPPQDSGTEFSLSDGTVSVDNQFNRLVLFDSQTVHSAQSYFGTTILDSRLTLVIFSSS